MPLFPRLPDHGLLLTGVALTRIIGWGSTFYAPAVIVHDLDRDLGMSGSVVFAGITILLVTGAALGPLIGRHVDREGTRRAMCVGALICALGLALFALASGPITYLASWLVIGVGHAMTLANLGSVTVAQLVSRKARQVMGLMMLVSGLASSVFWPLTAVLNAEFGWRTTWLIFAAAQVLVVLPIHAAIPRLHRPKAAAGPEAAASVEEQGRVSQSRRRMTFWLVAAAFCASGLVSWGLPLHFISLFETNGLSRADAVAIVALAGPASLLARLVDIALGERVSTECVALAGLLLGPLSCLVMAFLPLSPQTALGFIVVFSAAMGVISVARATLPLGLFGRSGFALILGRLAVPQNLAFAASPLLFALLIQMLGTQGTLIAAAAIQLAGFAAMLVLIQSLRRG